MPEGDDEEALTKQLAVRVTDRDVARVQKAAPGFTRAQVLRAALRLGLERIEEDPDVTRLALAGETTRKPGRKPGRGRRAEPGA